MCPPLVEEMVVSETRPKVRGTRYTLFTGISYPVPVYSRHASLFYNSLFTVISCFSRVNLDGWMDGSGRLAEQVPGGVLRLCFTVISYTWGQYTASMHPYPSCNSLFTVISSCLSRVILGWMDRWVGQAGWTTTRGGRRWCCSWRAGTPRMRSPPTTLSRTSLARSANPYFNILIAASKQYYH